MIRLIDHISSIFNIFDYTTTLLSSMIDITGGSSSRMWSRPQLLNSGRSCVCNNRKLSLFNFKGIDVPQGSGVDGISGAIIIAWALLVGVFGASAIGS